MQIIQQSRAVKLPINEHEVLLSCVKRLLLRTVIGFVLKHKNCGKATIMANLIDTVYPLN